MARVNPLPLVWLLSDARNDAMLASALRNLPPRSGFVFRHYHLAEPRRAARFLELAQIARRHGHLAVLARDVALAASWGADGVYGTAASIRDADQRLIRLATAHCGGEMQAAIAAGADGIFLSPVFPTASHSGAETLGKDGFHALAAPSPVPVIALGGMTPARAAELGWPRWGAIDGLSRPVCHLGSRNDGPSHHA